MGARFRMVATLLMLVSATAVTGLVGSPTASADAPSTASLSRASVATTPPCSTDIIGRGLLAGSVDTKNVLHFSYLLNGGACTDALYTLVVRNNYDSTQWALLVIRGDGKSKEIDFNQQLPWTPTQPASGGVVPPGSGICVNGVTVRRFHIDDIAPDPSDAPCEPLGGSARAFH